VHLTDDGERALSQRLGVSLADPLEGQCIETGTNAASRR
jgi:hypothetical protein